MVKRITTLYTKGQPARALGSSPVWPLYCVLLECAPRTMSTIAELVSWPVSWPLKDLEGGPCDPQSKECLLLIIHRKKIDSKKKLA